MNIHIKGTPKYFFQNLLWSILIVVGGTAVGLIVTWYIPIDPEQCYDWYAGVWHSEFALGNLLFSAFVPERLIMAPVHTSGYAWSFWFGIVTQVIAFITVTILCSTLFLMVTREKNKE